jgi:hypothetical protein
MNNVLLQRTQKNEIFAALRFMLLNHNAALSDGAGGALWLPLLT